MWMVPKGRPTFLYESLCGLHFRCVRTRVAHSLILKVVRVGRTTLTLVMQGTDWRKLIEAQFDEVRLGHESHEWSKSSWWSASESDLTCQSPRVTCPAGICGIHYILEEPGNHPAMTFLIPESTTKSVFDILSTLPQDCSSAATPVIMILADQLQHLHATLSNLYMTQSVQCWHHS